MMIRIFALVALSNLLLNSAGFAKDKVNLFCEVYTESGLKSIPLDEEVLAEKDDDDSYRVDEDEYLKVIDECDRHNKNSGKVLPSIIAKIGSKFLAFGSKLRKEKYRRSKEESARIKRDPEKVMVVFFHGTGSNPIDDINSESFPSYDEGSSEGGGELLSFLQSRMRANGAKEGLDFIALHGPGSNNLQVTNLHTKFMAKDAHSWTAGSALGSGATENVENAILHLKGITKNPALEDIMSQHINEIKKVGKLIVLGWSRGSVTAIQFASDLYHDPELKDIDVNLFVIDPVPGMGNISFGMWKNIFHIYPNVKGYFGAYAQDERSVGFTPVVPRISDSTDLFSSKRKAMVVAEFPGNHATLVGNIWNRKDRTLPAAEKVDSFASLARIIRGLAQAFIVSHGGVMSGIEYNAGRPSTTMDEISELMLKDFEIVFEDMAQFTALQREGYLGNQVQKMGKDRKYHQDWNVFGNFKRLNDVVQPLLPRYTAKDVKGFKIKYNYNNGERRWVNHIHKVLAQSFVNHGYFDVTEFFNPGYYKKYEKLIKNKI